MYYCKCKDASNEMPSFLYYLGGSQISTKYPGLPDKINTVKSQFKTPPLVIGSPTC